MKRMIRTVLCALLAAALLLSACGKENSPEPTEAPAPGTETASGAGETTTGTEAAAPAASVDTELEDYTLVCVPAEDNGTPAADGGGDGSAEYRFTAKLQKNGEAGPVFDVEIVMELPAAAADGSFGLSGAPLARYGDKWLFKVHYAPDDDDAYYIYDAAGPGLYPLGDYGSVLFVGDRLFLTPAVYAEEAEKTALLFDWDGQIVTGFTDVFDATLCGDAVYMLRQYEPCVLDMVPVSRLTDPSQVPEAERVCEFGRFNAIFYEGDKVVIQPLAGGYPTVCPISDVVATLQELTADD